MAAATHSGDVDVEGSEGSERRRRVVVEVVLYRVSEGAVCTEGQSEG